MAAEYTYAVGNDGGVPFIMRQEKDQKTWNVVCFMGDGVDPKEMVDDLNRAQRLRPTLEDGQELRQKPLTHKNSRMPVQQ